MDSKQIVDSKRSSKNMKKDQNDPYDHNEGRNHSRIKRRTSSSHEGMHYDVLDQLQDVYGPRESTYIKDDRIDEEKIRKKKRKKKRRKMSGVKGEKINEVTEAYEHNDRKITHEHKKKGKKQKKTEREKHDNGKRTIGRKDKRKEDYYEAKLKNKEPQQDRTSSLNRTDDLSEQKYFTGDEKDVDRSSRKSNNIDVNSQKEEYDDDFEEDQGSNSDDSHSTFSKSDTDESYYPGSNHSEQSESESELNIESVECNQKTSEDISNPETIPSYTPAPPLYQSPEHTSHQTIENSTATGTYLTWELKQHGPNITIDEETFRVATRKVAKQSTDGARTEQGFSNGRHTFEFQFNNKPWGSHCSVGVCSASTKLHLPGYADLFGTDPCSWAWDIPSRELLQNDSILGIYCDGFSVPKTITMMLDCDNRELWFEVITADGVSPCLHFTDVFVDNEELYPAVSMVYGLTEVMVNLKESTFKEEIKGKENVTPDPAREDRLTTDLEETEDERCQTTTTSLHDTDVEEKNVKVEGRITDDEIDKPEEQKDTAYVINEQFQQGVEEDEDSEEEEEEVALTSLPETERQILTIGHAWDDVARAGRIHLHPNAPDICVPAKNFGDKVQSLRSRRPLKKGRHCWLLQEVRVYEADSGEQEEGKPNNLIIGIVNENHRIFNYGFSLAQLGRHAWGWEPSTSKLWHGSGWTRYPPYEDNEDKDVDKFCSVDMKQGLVVALDIKKHTFEFISGQKSFGVASASISGQWFYPFLVYHAQAHKPVRIKYLGGPKSHLVALLEDIAKLPARDLDDVMHCKMIHGGTTRRSTTRTLEDKYRSNLMWGQRSINAQIEGNSATIPIGAAVVTDAWFGAGRHVVEFEILSGSPVLGAVGGDFPGYKAQNEAIVPMLGSCLQSWGWDLQKRSIYHAGICIGKYPPLHLDFDIESHVRYRMTLANGVNGEGMVSFAAVLESGAVQDMGVAFVNLPNNCWIAASCSDSGDVASLKVYYISGPEQLVQQLTSMSSSVCTIL